MMTIFCSSFWNLQQFVMESTQSGESICINFRCPPVKLSALSDADCVG